MPLYITVINATKFSTLEKSIGEEWIAIAKKEFATAHAEEIELAKKDNQYHHGLPWIRVIIDCGWSKRPLGHSYNANSGKSLTTNVM